jgi:methionine-gamma-lyase
VGLFCFVRPNTGVDETFERNFVNFYSFVQFESPIKGHSCQIGRMDKHLETRAMFAGYRPADANMAVKPPMHPASTFVFPDARTGAAHMETAYGVEGAETPPEGFIYSRLGNPTVHMAEQRLAAWDDSEDAALFGSGMAAITTSLLAWSDAHRPVWFVGPLYGGTHHFLEEVLPSMGREVHEIDHLDQLDSNLEAQGGKRPGVVYLETPANPTMQIQRIRTASEWAAKHSTDDHRIVVMVDNTYLGPVLQRPLEHGADLVLYSATKYLGGHSDLIAGGASGKADIVAKVKEFRTFLGGTIDPWTAWMLARSMETLHVRVERQQNSTGTLLKHLREMCGPQAVKSAWAADLAQMGQDVTVAEQQQRGGGAMIGLEIPGGREGAFAFLDALQVFKLAVSLGSTESLAEHPASMTHAGVPAEVKARTGITEGFVRLSVGLEHPEDLIQDVTQAWKVAAQVANLTA